MLTKKIVIWPGVDPKMALLALDNYIQTCIIEEWRHTATARRNAIVYVFTDGSAVVVYQTKTEYVIREC